MRIEQSLRISCLAIAAVLIVAIGALLLAIQRRHRMAAAEEKATYFAHHEPMTGLLNRPHFMKALDSAIADGPADRQIAVLCIDLEGLREINDLLGIENGDAALLRVAQRLRALTQDGALAARLNGAKFALARNVA